MIAAVQETNTSTVRKVVARRGNLSSRRKKLGAIYFKHAGNANDSLRCQVSGYLLAGDRDGMHMRCQIPLFQIRFVVKNVIVFLFDQSDAAM